MEAVQLEHAGKVRILVAEDSPTQRQIIKSVLGREGYQVILASDGIEAVAQAMHEAPDLIVLDIEMPKMNGYQVCRLLKDDRYTTHIPVVMLTSRNHETDKYWGLKTGADRYVTKDFQLSGLTREVRELLQQNGTAGASCRLPGHYYLKQEDLDVLSRVNDLLDRKLYEATIINEISRLNTLSEDSFVTISSVLSVIAKVTDCYVCSVLLIEERELIVHVDKPVGANYFQESKMEAIEAASSLLSSGLSGTGIRTATDADPAFIQQPGGDGNIRSELSKPLTARGKTIAMLSLNSPKAEAFTEDVRGVLDILEYPVSVVVDNARLHEVARQLAITDGLTRLFNHRHFYELLEQEFLRAQRYKTDLSMVMLDIDSFKQINDAHGHQVGDDILKELAGVVSREIRDVDILARYGGEEFAVLLPQTGIRQAAAVAERIREAVGRHRFEAPEGKIPVTVSLGVAAFPESSVNSHAELVQESDAALYEAKEGGKNRVVARTVSDADDKV